MQGISSTRSAVIGGGLGAAVLVLLIFFAVAVPDADQLLHQWTAEEALHSVRLLPEVAEYVRRVPGARVDVDHRDEDGFRIHVYEMKEGHTATFNWYTVDPMTGETSAMFGAVAEESGIEKQSQWISYRHPSHGYTLWHPSLWILEDSEPATARIRIDSPDNAATFVVSALGDDRLKMPDGLASVFAEIREGFEKDARYTLEDYEDGAETGNLLAGMYIARGEFQDGNTTYRFKEMGILLKDGRMFVTTAHIRNSATQEYGDLMDEMIGAFDPFGMKNEKPTMTL